MWVLDWDFGPGDLFLFWGVLVTWLFGGWEGRLAEIQIWEFELGLAFPGLLPVLSYAILVTAILGTFKLLPLRTKRARAAPRPAPGEVDCGASDVKRILRFGSVDLLSAPLDPRSASPAVKTAAPEPVTVKYRFG